MNETLRHVSRFVSQAHWAILPSKLDAICELLAMRRAGIVMTNDEVQARMGAASSRSGSSRAGAVAVIPLYGVIAQKMNMMTQFSGGTSLDQFMASFRGALSDPSVSAIVIDVDSPGGTVYGVPEAAAELLAARGRKPMIAQANPMIASAAYWLMAACDEIVCMPSGDVGSIGVLAVHEDFSGANAQAGVKPTYIYAGQYKTECNPDEPLSDGAKNYLQGQIDATYHDFTSFVAKARGRSVAAVEQLFGQGRMLLAKDALAVGMIDRIGTLDSTIQRVAQSTKAGGVRSALRAGQADRDALQLAIEIGRRT